MEIIFHWHFLITSEEIEQFLNLSIWHEAFVPENALHLDTELTKNELTSFHQMKSWGSDSCLFDNLMQDDEWEQNDGAFLEVCSEN